MVAETQKQKIELEQGKVLRVCFVCTGNTCRSPMAAALLNKLGEGRFCAVSAGLCTSGGSDMSENAKQALRNAGIEPPAHCSRQLNADIIRENDLVIGISSSHLMVMIQSFPEYASKFEAFSQDVGDPYGADLATYERCLAQITDCIRQRFLL